MLYAGLRRGEVAALDIAESVDFTSQTIKVTRAVSFLHNKPELKETKSEAGNRTIPVFSPLKPYLDNAAGLAAKFADSPQARNTVDKQNTFITRQSFMCGFNDFMRLAGVRCTAHDLRHTWFTMMYDAGIDIKTAQRWGGHATAAMTIELYTHLSEQRETQSRKMAEEYFSSRSVGQAESQVL